jgi:hypothetical protein
MNNYLLWPIAAFTEMGGNGGEKIPSCSSDQELENFPYNQGL